jgi:hypothetical protein
VVAVERWLPVLGVAIGLSLMAVAMVAEGQPIPGQAAPPAMSPEQRALLDHPRWHGPGR